jgi:DNA-binding LytR/AlgR family response regulator
MKTQTQEVEFYSNMDAILSGLPDWFIRCHKGFIVTPGALSPCATPV